MAAAPDLNMGHEIALDTPSGRVCAWRADPVAQPAGGLVVIQEIFGVNEHVRSLVERYCAEGWVALAPELFDPIEHSVELAYDEAGVAKGRALAAELGFDRAVGIVGAAASKLREDGLKVGAVGFCWGGTVALLANTRLGLPAVSFYGGRSVQFLGESLRAPMMFHFGEHDPVIPPADVDKHRAAYPDAPMHVYPAGHGFHCEQRADYHGDAARVAHRRTLEFLSGALA